MEKSKNKYTATSLTLTTIGILLSIQSPPFYIDILILFVALGFGIVAFKRGER
jgi:hypothetical protein